LQPNQEECVRPERGRAESGDEHGGEVALNLISKPLQLNRVLINTYSGDQPTMPLETQPRSSSCRSIGSRPLRLWCGKLVDFGLFPYIGFSGSKNKSRQMGRLPGEEGLKGARRSMRRTRRLKQYYTTGFFRQIHHKMDEISDHAPSFIKTDGSFISGALDSRQRRSGAKTS